MKLITLTASHLFGLKHNVRFDFTENNRICIIGENGSGKSSVMDSIRLALFGEASQSRPVNIKDYIRRGATDGSVMLEFEDKRGRRHRVTRKFRKNAKEAVVTGAVLETMTPRGWEEIASSVSAVNFAVSSLLLYGRIRDDVKDADVIKQAKSSADIAAFISQGNISKILSVTPHERTALVSSALNIQDGDLLKERVKELKKLAEYEKEALKAKTETFRNSLKAIPSISELTESRKKIELDIELYSASLALLGEGASILGRISETTSGLQGHMSSKARQEELISQMRHSYSYGEYIKARKDLFTKTAKFLTAARPVFTNAPLYKASKEKMRDLFELKKNLYRKRMEMQEKYSLLQSVAELYPVLSEEDSLQKRLSASVKQLDEREISLHKAKKESDRLGKEAEGVLAKLEQISAYMALQSASGAEKEIKELSGSLLAHLVELLKTLGHGDIIDLKKLSLSGAENFIERMKDSSFQAILFEIKTKKTMAESCMAEAEAYKQKYGTHPGKCDMSEKEGLEQKSAQLASEKDRASDMERRLSEDISLSSREIFSLKSMLAENTERRKRIMKKNSIEETPSLSDAEKAASGAADIRKQISAMDAELTEMEAEYTALLNKVSHWESEEVYFKGNRDGLIEAIKEASLKTKEALESCVAATGAYTMAEAAAEAAAADRKTIPSDDDMRQAELNYSALLQMISKDSETLKKLRAAYEELRKKDDILLPSLRKDIDVKDLASHVTRELAEKNRETATLTREAGRLSQLIRQHMSLSDQLEKAEDQLEQMAPVFVCVKQLVSLADANFSRYICDRTMELLLNGVNKHLSTMGIEWRLGSESGNLMVTDASGEKRPVSGMSGGEGTLISILLLKQIANFNCLWLDESLTMLDEGKMSEVTDILTGGDPDAQVIVISHDKDLARTFDTVWEMDSGEKVREKSQERSRKAVITAEDLRDGDYELI